MNPVPSPSSLLEALPRLAGLRVLVLGDVMLDIFDFCSSAESKLIPSEKPGKRAYTAHESVRRMGGAGNVATNLAALGARTTLVGLTGNDGPHHTLVRMCEEAGIAHCLLQDASRPTTTKTRIYIDNDYLLRKDHESTAKADHETALSLAYEFVLQLEAGADAVVLSDYDKGVFTGDLVARIGARLSGRDVPVVVDFKPANRALFAGCYLLVPNESEADALWPGFKGADRLEEAVRGLAAALEARRVVVTLGGRGLCGFDGQSFFHVPGNRVEAVDAVGCGDTVRAVLALGLGCGLGLREAAALANDAAAVSVQKPATATLSLDELRAFVATKTGAAG